MKLQNNYYFVRQICSLIIILIGFVICLYSFNRNRNIVSQNNIVDVYIVDKHCNGAKGTSSLNVIYNQSVYNVKYGRRDCIDVNIGEKIKLYYGKENDVLINQGRLENNIFQLIVASIALFFLLLPWKRFLS